MKNGSLQFYRGDHLIAEQQAMVTESVLERMRGLLFREPLAVNQSLWIKACQSIHTFFMTYSIDLAYINKNQEIVKLVDNVRPFRLSCCFAANDVIEMNVNSIAAMKIKCGDRCVWRD